VAFSATPTRSTLKDSVIFVCATVTKRRNCQRRDDDSVKTRRPPEFRPQTRRGPMWRRSKRRRPQWKERRGRAPSPQKNREGYRWRTSGNQDSPARSEKVLVSPRLPPVHRLQHSLPKHRSAGIPLCGVFPGICSCRLRRKQLRRSPTHQEEHQ